MENSKQSGFTLIELLMVIAIIGILAGILIPVIGKVREQANIAASKATISQYLNAIEAFRGEYSYYPFSAESISNGRFDLRTVANSKLFYETLSGRDIGNPETRVQTGGNRRGISFYTFSQDELADGDFVAEGVARNTIVDRFGNNRIIIAFDHNNTGVISVPDPDNPPANKEVRTKLTAYVEALDAIGGPAYQLYD